jgi:hypothetical protein
MAFIKKGAPSAKSLDFGIEAPVPGVQTNAGNSPVNSKGQVTDRAGQTANWPYSPASPDEAVNPRQNPKVPPYLDPNGRGSSGSNKVSPTLG